MKKFFQKIVTFFAAIKAIITKTIPQELVDYSEKSLEITYRIKQALESPVADIVTAIIPTEFDDNLRKKMIQYLNEALPYLIIVRDCNNKGDLGEMLKCWIEQLSQHDKHTRNALLIKLAAMLTRLQDNGELKQSQYDYAVQALYTGVIKEGNFQKKYEEDIKKLKPAK